MKIPTDFPKCGQADPKIHMELQGTGPQTAKTVLEKNNKIRELTLLNFKTDYKATVIQTV